MLPDKAKRREAFQRLDAYLERIYRDRRTYFYLLAVGLSIAFCTLLWLVVKLLLWIIALPQGDPS